MRRSRAWPSAVFVLWLATLLPVGSVVAGTTTAHVLPAQGYTGSRERQYKVHVPDGLNGPAPLVMALHGCRQKHDDVLRDWGLVAAAERHRFILVAPFVTSYDDGRSENCWAFWSEQHRHQGRGEAEDLHRIAKAVEARHPVDPKRRHVLGLSSGGAMAVVLSVTHNEYFASVASAAGVAYGEGPAAVSRFACPGWSSLRPVERTVADMRRERDSTYRMPLLVLQNRRDCTVLLAAAHNLRDAQLAIDGGAARATQGESRTREQPCAPFFREAWGCRHTFHTVDAQPGSRSIVETVIYDGPLETPDPSDNDRGHYWIGGSEGRDGRWAVRAGPSYPDIAWDFFKRHPVDASGGTGPGPGGPTCTEVRATPGSHVAAGRAIAGGWFLMRALSSGDQRDIGYAYDFAWSSVTLYEGAGGRWYAQRPSAC